jgi:hypothetical protein
LKVIATPTVDTIAGKKTMGLNKFLKYKLELKRTANNKPKITLKPLDRQANINVFITLE